MMFSLGLADDIWRAFRCERCYARCLGSFYGNWPSGEDESMMMCDGGLDTTPEHHRVGK